MLASKVNPHVNFLSWEPLGPHRTASIPCNPEYRLPERRIVQRFANANAAQMMVEGGVEGNVEGHFLSHSAINRLKSDYFANDQFNVFPNVSIHISLNGYWTTSYWPITKETSRWRTTFYYTKPQSLREDFSINFATALQRDIFAEDNSCFQKQQSMLQSGAKKFVQLGEAEILLRHQHAVIAGIEKNREDGSSYAMAAE
jgi:hypothetical protein